MLYFNGIHFNVEAASDKDNEMVPRVGLLHLQTQNICQQSHFSFLVRSLVSDPQHRGFQACLTPSTG